MTVTVDSTAYTADATWPSADGFIPANIVFAEISEPVGGHVTADTTAYTADATYPTADGYIEGGARDLSDAIRIPAIAYGGGGRRRTRLAVVGVGYGVLPELEGEAHGTVYDIAGEAAATLSIAGAATGEADDGLDELIMLMLLAA